MNACATAISKTRNVRVALTTSVKTAYKALVDEMQMAGMRPPLREEDSTVYKAYYAFWDQLRQWESLNAQGEDLEVGASGATSLTRRARDIDDGG